MQCVFVDAEMQRDFILHMTSRGHFCDELSIGFAAGFL
jgi:hypothetical protein